MTKSHVFLSGKSHEALPEQPVERSVFSGELQPLHPWQGFCGPASANLFNTVLKIKYAAIITDILTRVISTIVILLILFALNLPVTCLAVNKKGGCVLFSQHLYNIY